MVKGVNGSGEESHYLYNGLGVLVANEWVIERNAYGYAGLDTEPSYRAADGAALVCDRHSNTSGQGHQNPVGNGHFSGETPQKPTIDGGNYAVVHKDYVVDYTKLTRNVLMEYEAGADGLTYRYTYGLEHATGALANSVVIYGIPNGAGSVMQSYHGEQVVKLYYHHDRQGTSEYLTNNIDGKVESYVSYDSWGELTMKPILNMGVRQLDLVTSYTGYSYDAVLELYYAQARMYDAANRRFTAVDPVRGDVRNPQTMAQYTYVLNNPVRYVDPLGLSAVPLSDWDQANLSSSQQAQIRAYKDAWASATTQAERDAAHAGAEAVRDTVRTGTERGTGDGNTVGNPDPKKPDPPDLSQLTPEQKDLYDGMLDVVSEFIDSMSDDDLLSWASEAGGDWVMMVNIVISTRVSQELHKQIEAVKLLSQHLTFEMARTLVSSTANNIGQRYASTLPAVRQPDHGLGVVLINNHEIGLSSKNGNIYGSLTDLTIAVGGTLFTTEFSNSVGFSALIESNSNFIEYFFANTGMFIWNSNTTLFEGNSNDYTSTIRTGSDWIGFNGRSYDYGVDIESFVDYMKSIGISIDRRDFEALYTSPDNAALAWYDKHLADSIEAAVEWGGFIYSIDVINPSTGNVTSKFFATGDYKSDHFSGDYYRGIDTSMVTQPNLITDNVDLFVPDKDQTLVGWIHTHGNWGKPSDGAAHSYWNFSWGDMEYTATTGITGYLGNINGEVYRMNTDIINLYYKYPNKPRWQDWHGRYINSSGIYHNEALDIYIFKIGNVKV